MAGPPKQAPVETFLSTVSTTRTVHTPSQTADEDSAEAARAVLLTILSKNPTIPDDKLMRMSELGPALYADTLSWLVAEELVQTVNQTHSLTSRGREAFEKQRERLLSLR